MDGEFDILKTHLAGVVIHIACAEDHVGKIEQTICTIKERTRGIINTLPFKTLPKWMLIKMMHHVVMWLNAFPTRNGISTRSSPQEIVTQTGLDFQKHC